MEIRPNNIKKFNKPVIGLLLGTITPILCFLGYYIYLSLKSEGLSFTEFFETLKQTNGLVAVLSMCILPNLIFFFMFKKLDYWYAMKGLLTTVIIYVMLIFLIKFI